MFINSKNSNISDPQGLLINLADEIDFRWNEQYIALSNLCINYLWKI